MLLQVAFKRFHPLNCNLRANPSIPAKLSISVPFCPPLCQNVHLSLAYIKKLLYPKKCQTQPKKCQTMGQKVTKRIPKVTKQSPKVTKYV